MPKVRWMILYRFCSKFHALSSTAQILKIGRDLTKSQSLKVGTFLRDNVIHPVQWQSHGRNRRSELASGVLLYI